MIFGIGTDIVQIKRMRDSLEKFGDKFARRILAESEFTEFKQVTNKASYLAKRFAAKEATAKAMGTGFTAGLSLQHIAVNHDDAGKPILDFYELAKIFKDKNGIKRTHISLSDERDYAIAFVTLEL